MEKLIEDGVWKHRYNELLPVEFTEISDAAKDNYIFKILQLAEEDRSTYEKVILRIYQKEKEFKSKNVRTVDEDFSTSTKKNTNIDANILDEVELIKNIPNLSKQDIEDLLDDYYSHTYTNWKFDLYQSKLENFISATNNEFNYSNYIIGLLTTYKKFK